MKISQLAPVLALLIPGVAAADDNQHQNDQAGFDRYVAPLSKAIEIGVSTGYAQGGGPIGSTMQDLDQLSGPGGAVELQLGYRINPTFAVGLYGQFSAFDSGDVNEGDNVFGAGAGIMGTAHLRPGRSIDPWVSLSTGWKALWLDHEREKTTSLQGFDLARVQIGVDYRISKGVAITPVIGGSLGMFVGQQTAMTDGYDEISDKKVNFTGFAGLSGRFGVGL